MPPAGPFLIQRSKQASAQTKEVTGALADLGRVFIAIGALIFVGGLVVTFIDSVVWFETGRLPALFRDALWMDLPVGLTAIVGPVIGVAGALAVHR
jgi:hypothetical protein